VAPISTHNHWRRSKFLNIPFLHPSPRQVAELALARVIDTGLEDGEATQLPDTLKQPTDWGVFPRLIESMSECITSSSTSVVVLFPSEGIDEGGGSGFGRCAYSRLIIRLV
jgi:hypothetical protein